MLIPDVIRKCVVFIGYSDIHGKFYLAGTAFAVHTKTEERFIAYLVTCKHIIDEVRDKGVENLYIRVNLKDHGARWIAMSFDNWLEHPTDKSVDVVVALLPKEIREALDITIYPIGGIVTPERIAEFDIGVGNEVFLTGLFVRHLGIRRNIPIVRVGNIAAMLEEQVPVKKFGLIDAYLVECRSFGGLSGSPVFVHLGAVRVKNGKMLQSTTDHGVFFLLGLMHGHWNDEGLTSADVLIEDNDTRERVNMGIAVVVPGGKIKEVVTQPKFKALEDQIVAKEKQDNLPTPDSAVPTDEPPFTKADFEAALKKVARKVEPEK